MGFDLENIVRRCVEKEETAFEILYKKYYRILFGIALRYSRNNAEAEDILQESFIKIFNQVSTVRSIGSFEGWMKRIVQNTAINSYHKNFKYNLHVEISDQSELSTGNDVFSALETFDVGDITRFLNLLPDGYRMVLNLYYIDGYSHKEISQMLNINIGTSKSQLFKAKANLKTIIESYSAKNATWKKIKI